MKYEVYAPLAIADDFSKFDFISQGPKGDIHKRIMFTPTEEKNIYNLAFGDVDEQGDIDDYVISDNGDRDKIFSTIADFAEVYLSRYPRRWLYFEGSTAARTRLYRMAIGLHLEELSRKFDIYGRLGERIMPFRKNMILTAFIVKKKM